MPILNFTGRRNIPRALVGLSADKAPGPLGVWVRLAPELRADPAFAGCDVVLEAYLRTKAQRVPLGRLSDLPDAVRAGFGEFPNADDVRFRLKIVDPKDKRIAGEVGGLAVSERRKPEEDRRRKRSILPVNWAVPGDNMKNRFWKVSFAGPEPTLLLKPGKFASLRDVFRPEFRALAHPAILREVLFQAFVVEYACPPSWAEDWEELVHRIDGSRPPDPPADGESPDAYFEAVSDWIDSACESFAADQEIARIDSSFKTKRS